MVLLFSLWFAFCLFLFIHCIFFVFSPLCHIVSAFRELFKCRICCWAGIFVGILSKLNMCKPSFWLPISPALPLSVIRMDNCGRRPLDWQAWQTKGNRWQRLLKGGGEGRRGVGLGHCSSSVWQMSTNVCFYGRALSRILLFKSHLATHTKKRRSSATQWQIKYRLPENLDTPQWSLQFKFEIVWKTWQKIW